MKILFWLLAFIITAAVAIYQRTTGPTYPVSGEISIENEKIDYTFSRSHGGETNHPVQIVVSNENMNGILYWKRFKTDDEWNEVEMLRRGDTLFAELPHQPPAGKLQYYVKLFNVVDEYSIPIDDIVVIRFKGAVPVAILILHVIAMFGAMLLSTRTGLEFFNKNSKHEKLTIWTIAFLFIGGFILGPIVQKYAFDAYWTGFPFGHDLTDNKTVVALIGWIIAFFMFKKSKHPKRWVLFAAILLIAVYLIPHSVLGSELDYKELDKGTNQVELILRR